jgi:hypothetical protein
MQIDNYEEGQALTEKVKANLPIKVFPTKHLVQSLRQQGKDIKPNQAYEIDSAFYSGDMGGITCTLKGSSEDKEVFAVSITHLKIDPDHPLAPEIEAYQRQRTRMLAIQNSGGFAAELLAARAAKLIRPGLPKAKKKNTKGFGQ